MGNARGGNDPQGQPARCCLLSQNWERVGQPAFAIASGDIGANPQNTDLGLDASVHRACRAGTIGHLRVAVIGFYERNILENLERQDIFLAALPLLLAGIDPRGCDRRNSHTVTDEQDDVLGLGLGRRGWHCRCAGNLALPISSR